MLKFNCVTYVSTVLDLFNLNTSYVKVQSKPPEVISLVLDI